MRAHQINEFGEIINTLVVDSFDFLPNLISADIGGGIGDKIIAGELIVKKNHEKSE